MPTDRHHPLFDAAFDAEAAREFSLTATLGRVRRRRRTRKAVRGLSAAAALALLMTPLFYPQPEAPQISRTIVPAETPPVPPPPPPENPLMVRSRPLEPEQRVRSLAKSSLVIKTPDAGAASRVARVSTSPEARVPRLEQLAFNQLLAENDVACISIGGEPFRIVPLHTASR